MIAGLPGWLLAVTAATQAASPVADASRVFASASPSVVVVLALDAAGSVRAQGSGVVVAPGVVVTSRRVVADASSVRLLQGERTRSAKVVELHGSHDLATLRASIKAPAAVTRASSTLVVGERVVAIGARQGLALSSAEATISQLQAEAGGFRIQTTAALSAGSAGGGLFDERGALIGITTHSLLPGHASGSAQPTEWFAVMVADAVARAEEPTRVTLRAEPRAGATRIVIEGDGGPLDYTWRSDGPGGAVLELPRVDASAVSARVDVRSPEVDHVRVETVREGNREVTRFHFVLVAPMRQRVYPESGNLNLLFERAEPAAAQEAAPSPTPESMPPGGA